MALSEKEQIEKELIRRELEKRQAAAQPRPAAAPSQLEAGVRGLAQGVSFGFADEASGAIGAAVTGLSDTVANFASGKLEFGDFVGEYQRQVEEARAADAAAQEAFPKTFTAGEIGGALASGVATGGAGLATKGLGGVLKVGAGLGGLAAAGKSEADLTRGEIKEFAGDVGIGTAIGAVTGLGGEALSKSLGAVGRRVLPQKAQDIAANVIKPKAIAADLRNAAKASTKKAFDQRTNKNLVKGVEGLQNRGVLPTERAAFQSMDKREMFKAVRKESNLLGESIENITKAADEAGVDFGSNQLGIAKLREVTKAVKKGSTNDEFITAVGNVEDLLQNQQFKASDLFGLKQELDGLIKTGSTLKAVKKSQMKQLMGVRTQIKEALEDKIDDAALKSPELRATLDKHGTKDFAELNDAFGDTVVVRDTLADAAAIAEFEEGAALASPLSEQIANLTRQEGVVSAITGGAGRVVGGVSEGVVRGGAALGGALRKAEQQGAVIARQLYQSLDEDNIINDEADRKAHAGRVMNNNTLSHAQKFREINQLQTTGKINPESIPQRDKRQVLRDLEAQRKAMEAEILQGL